MDLLPFDPEQQDYSQEESVGNMSIFAASAIEGKPTSPYENLFKGFSPALLYSASACCVIFMLVGIPGNLFTIIALARCKKVRNATAVFIINLSCSDLLFCCFNLPLAATTFYYREWVHGELMCRLFPLFRYGLLAVSLFTILTITINRYIMIGHPRVYPRIYRRKWLTLMVFLTWACAFASLIQTWRGKWGKFGMDTSIGSCSILPANGKSPKEFLFVMAFILPCFAIVLCYARIFYIVRKTAMKTHEAPKVNGSIRLSHNVVKNNSNCSPGAQAAQRLSNSNGNKNLSQQQQNQRPSIEVDEFNQNTQRDEKVMEDSKAIFDEHRRKHIAKLKDDDLKFIDTSFESDLPPTLSQLQRKSVQISIENAPLAMSSPSSPTPTTTAETVATTIISSENEIGQLNSINKEVYGSNVGNTMNGRKGSNCVDLGVDSAVEDSTVSLEQNNLAHHLLSIPEPSSSSSGIELPYDIQESPKKKATRRSAKAPKIKHKKIKDENQQQEVTRKKSLANTSGASIIYSGRMSSKDRRLLKMILAIFVSFLICYLPITLTKISHSFTEINFLFITSYLLIYLTTCINPIIYVVMSSEYRQAYKQLLMCRLNNSNGGNANMNPKRKT